VHFVGLCYTTFSAVFLANV